MKTIYFVWMVSENSSFEVYFNNLFSQFEKNEKIKVVDKTYKYNTKMSKSKIFFSYLSYILSLRKISSWTIIEITNANIIPPITLHKNVYKVHVCHDFFLYDDDFHSDKNLFSKIIDVYNKYIHKTLYRCVFNRANRIIAISDATKKEIISKFGSKNIGKICIIYNWMDIEKFLSENKKNKKEKYILYVWSEIPRKNLKWVIEAFAIVKNRFPDLKLYKAPKETNKVCRNNTLKNIYENNLKIWKDIVFFDEYLPLDRLIELYQKASIFVFPSIKEWFWLPIIEAQACWTPFIKSNYEPMSELVPYKDMLANPLDSKDIADKIIKILNSQDLMEKMIDDWFENAKKFTWENTAKWFFKVLDL